MLRTIIAALAAFAAIGLTTGIANAQPKFCDGGMYKTACHNGGGGAGPTFHWTDSNGKTHFDRASDIPASHYPAAAPN